MTLKQKSDYTIGERVVFFESGEEVPGTIVDCQYHLGNDTQYVVQMAEDRYVMRPASLLWLSDEVEGEDRQNDIDALVEDLKDILAELASLSTDKHPVIPFMFFGLVNGDEIEFETFIPETEFTVGDDTEIDLDASPLPALRDVGLYDDHNSEDFGLCDDYPNCACGELDKAQAQDYQETPPSKEGVTLSDLLSDILTQAEKKNRK